MWRLRSLLGKSDPASFPCPGNTQARGLIHQDDLDKHLNISLGVEGKHDSVNHPLGWRLTIPVLKFSVSFWDPLSYDIQFRNGLSKIPGHWNQLTKTSLNLDGVRDQELLVEEWTGEDPACRNGSRPWKAWFAAACETLESVRAEPEVRITAHLWDFPPCKNLIEQ